MNCDELRDHYELYAMGAAEEPEQSEIRAHLTRGCEVCMTEMKRARALAAVIGGTVQSAAPSPKLRRRILAAVGVEHRSWFLTPLLTGAAALSLFAAVYFGGREREVVNEALRLREQMRTQAGELARLNEVFSILNAAGTTVTNFGPGQPKGRVFVNPAQGVVLFASNLQPAPAGKRYEMWVIPKSGKPIPAGLFQAGSDNTAVHVLPGPVNVAATGAIAVTLEDERGAEQPTSSPLIVAPVQ